MDIASHIQPLHINGMNGRMLHLPSHTKNNRHILLLYGHHASIERMTGIAMVLNDYGDVVLPDFPGFGGMDSFYKIGLKPTLDNLADYLAAVIKLKYKNKKVTICGMSLGFVIATRMLQKYPHLTKQVDLLVSIVGFTHKDELRFTKPRYNFYRYGAAFFSMRLPASFFKNVILHPWVLRTVYHRMHNAKSKFDGLEPEAFKESLDFEIYLWRCNDVRTYMKTTVEMLTLDNCQKYIALPVHHITVSEDQYFDGRIVEQHMRVIFTDYIEHVAVLKTHAPSIIADKGLASSFVPVSVKKLLKGHA